MLEEKKEMDIYVHTYFTYTSIEKKIYKDVYVYVYIYKKNLYVQSRVKNSFGQIVSPGKL